MPHLKYYEDEEKRHADIADIKLTQDQIRDAVKVLCKHFKLKNLPIEFNSRIISYFHEIKLMFGFSRYQQDPLTVAHEVAHYIDFKRRQKNWRVRNQKWHGPFHRLTTDKCIEILRKKGFIERFVTINGMRFKSIYPVGGII